MIEFYLPIRHAHIGLVLVSGGLFALRGAAVLAGQRWANAAPLRRLSYGIDTLLLTAALMLLVILDLNPFTTAWLATKLVLLAAYVVLGVFALRRARSYRALWYLAALACFGLMYSVARSHDPLGPFAAWLA